MLSGTTFIHAFIQFNKHKLYILFYENITLQANDFDAKLLCLWCDVSPGECSNICAEVIWSERVWSAVWAEEWDQHWVTRGGRETSTGWPETMRAETLTLTIAAAAPGTTEYRYLQQHWNQEKNVDIANTIFPALNIISQ